MFAPRVLARTIVRRSRIFILPARPGHTYGTLRHVIVESGIGR
jgi:hypothetical protein